MRRRLQWEWAAASCAILAACGSPVAPTLSSIQTHVFAPSCTFSSCHSASGHAGDLVLESGKSFANLFNQPAAQDRAALEQLLRVQPGAPDQSFLAIKLRAGMPAKYGIHMPNGQGQIDADQLQAIEEWIRRGALDN